VAPGASFSAALWPPAGASRSGSMNPRRRPSTSPLWPRDEGYPPTIFHDFYAPEGTTDHLLLVDAEIGVILRVAARLEDREFYVAEVTEIAFDEDFPEGTFRLELPGVEFRRMDR